MKNYLFKVTTDKNKGIGHFYRSFEISQRLKIKYNSSNVYFLNETNLQPEINIFSKKVNFLHYKNIDDILLILKNMNISHLIFDQVNDCFNESQIIRKKFSDLKIFAFDYFKFNNKNINKFINIYSKKHHQSLTFNKNLKFSYGFDNVIIRKNFYKYINKNKINNDKKLNVVITFGGSDPMNYTEKVLSHINYIKIPNVAFKILVPLNKKHKFLILRISII